MRELLLSLLVPLRCLACGEPGTRLCDRCDALLERIAEPRCRCCGAPTHWPVDRCRECRGRRLAFDAAWAAVAHRGVAARLVHRWKDGGLDLSEIAAGIVADARPPPAVSCLAVVPAERSRARRRGVDGPGALAAHLGASWDIPVDARMLRRVRATAPQRGRLARERRANVRGAFTAVASGPDAVALVDDVYTTGATVDAGARALRAAGVRRIEVITFARALRE